MGLDLQFVLSSYTTVKLYSFAHDKRNSAEKRKLNNYVHPVISVNSSLVKENEGKQKMFAEQI